MKNSRLLSLSWVIVLFIACSSLLSSCKQEIRLKHHASSSDLDFVSTATTWDEGIPLGNAFIGQLVWQKGDKLRFSLDCTELWDLRPMDSISGQNNRFKWVKEQVYKKNYTAVQKKFDWPYDRNPAPSKIPGAALEFPMNQLGDVSNVHLYLNDALCTIDWKSGTSLTTFVQAKSPVGWFLFKGVGKDFVPALKTPAYAATTSEEDLGPVVGLDLRRLNYKQGKVEQGKNYAHYHQKGWGNFYYDVAVVWRHQGDDLIGVWSISSSLEKKDALVQAQKAIKRGIQKDYTNHRDYWTNYWDQSSISIPDAILQKQYDNEMYKFGSSAREHSRPISLQSVWTADNGKLPPWKGDYHHDLNTQLSYWPAYTGNHLSEAKGYLNTLWNQRDVYKKYTRTYFQKEGLNVPGVCTLTGEPMGGWIQYSMSQTCSAWLAHHFYLQWKYSADTQFLESQGYPFVRDVATFLEHQTTLNKEGIRTLDISSSPEIYDNSIKAWFRTITNYDLALTRSAFKEASEMAAALDKPEEMKHWSKLESQLPPFALDKDSSLAFAKGFPYNQSHRHFSHAMAIHPLGVIDWSDGEASQRIIKATIKRLDDFGPDYWTGYSYAWFANMKARAFDGEGAAQALRTFAECFCLKNTFHVNGDQTNSGKSKFTYRPFTLEGNFAFAAGIQEMLLQSHTGIIRLFPAIPDSWEKVSFHQLRAMGAFLISAQKKKGKLTEVDIISEKGGLIKMALSKEEYQRIGQDNKYHYNNGILTIKTKPGEHIVLDD